jgi:hypothetical protein
LQAAAIKLSKASGLYHDSTSNVNSVVETIGSILEPNGINPADASCRLHPLNQFSDKRQQGLSAADSTCTTATSLPTSSLLIELYSKTRKPGITAGLSCLERSFDSFSGSSP